MSDGYLLQESGFFTRAIHGDESSWPLVPSITVSSTFEHEAPDRDREIINTCIHNPSRQMLEKCLAKIENAKYSLCFSSGIGAVTTITCLLSAGDHIVAGEQLYGGTARLFEKIFARMNIQTTFVDTCDPKNIENALTGKTKLVWVETPTNPLLKITDLAKVAEIVHKKDGVLLAVDNTFFTPYFQRPLELGADISMHSITKFINGHSDCIMGSISTNNELLYKKLHFLQQALGIIPSPFDCYQVLESLKTLPLRMDQQMKNSLALAKYLETHLQVEKVFHTGLPSHPQHVLVKKQCSGASGILSFYVRGGLNETKMFIKALKVIKYAGSLGGYTTTVIVPSFRSHASMTEEKRVQLGITDNLIRMSVGLESIDDLIVDIKQAFNSS